MGWTKLKRSAIDERALSTLTGLAAGDAMGMPSQTLARSEIAARYGRISDFVRPFEEHPVSHGLQAAQVTDDTEQTLLLAHRLISSPNDFDDVGWATDLLTWEVNIRSKGLSDLLGPSSKAAIEALLAGVPPQESGRDGTTNGAAMRIAPIGIVTAPQPDEIAAATARTCRVTHNTGEAIAAAAAVAMTISCGLDGESFDASLAPALAAARQGQILGNQIGDQDIAGRIDLALTIAETGDEEKLVAEIGTSVASRESVPMAFGLLKMERGRYLEAVLHAANLGGDTDTIGSIVGAMGGATGGVLPKTTIDKLMAANDLNLAETAKSLVDLRLQALNK